MARETPYFASSPASGSDAQQAVLDLVFADADLALVVKPSGLLSVPGRGPDKSDCVVNRLVARFGWAREVHRLDMDTSGLMVVALSQRALSDLARQFRQRQVGKQYIALVAQAPDPPEGAIDLPIRLDVDNRPIRIVDHELGKPSTTRYQTIETNRGPDGLTIARLRLTPLTGRSHQLRVHCAAIGHPILGDDLYGNGAASAPRLALHASRLEFTHPVSRERCTFTSEAPF